ncbi:MAG: hypothetical protein HFH66_17225 [Lachnospiraceae bacterium]|nr:hypothetical protein [Lachnospiraceae bacterium]
MTVTELNNYIKHYLEEDKTHTAIMLTGEWGSGKTYYIENELIPFLQDGKKNKCVVISLYGLEDISEISKSIYMELRMKSVIKDSEMLTTGKIVVKTVIKNVFGKFGIDTNMSDDDLQNVYSSVDLDGKLLIFEDLERSHIEIIKLLGYINNLVERDGVKVLLVANENEILNKQLETISYNLEELVSSFLENNIKEDKENSVPEDVQVQKYLRIKEKTISDTIYFESDYFEAIKNIIGIFRNEKLQTMVDKDKDIIDELVSMIKGYCHKNFRTFIFATQKTVDIFNKIEEDYEHDFLKCIYYGIICFSSKMKAGEFPEWEGTEYLSTSLGTNWQPLFKFCYDYIRWQKIEVEDIAKTRDAYDKMKLYDKNADQQDTDLQKLYSYYERTESEVKDTLKSIEKRLKNPDDIGFYSYRKLAAYLVMISHVIEFDYAQCKEYMVKNIRGKGRDIDSHLLFLPMYDNLEENEKAEFKNFTEQLSESMNFRNNQNDFSYNPSDLKDLYESVLKELYKISGNHEFISKYNVSQLVEMLFQASARQIEDFRGTLFAIYRYAGKADFIEADINTMKELLQVVQEKINSNDYQNYDIDKIQLLQLRYLCRNLKTFITQMS